MKNAMAKIKGMIYEIRGHKVMLDSDLAGLYEVEPRTLNQAVKRNIGRFPKDFMFQLTKDEFTEVITICDHLQNLKYRSTMPYAFTEHGILMLYIEKNDRRVNDIIIALNNLISQPVQTKQIGFRKDNN